MLAPGNCQCCHQSWSWGCHFSQTLPLPLSLLLPLPHHFAHKNDSFSFLRIFQISGGCCIPLWWNRRKKDGRTLISDQHSSKARLGFLIAEFNAWDQQELKCQSVINSQIFISVTLAVSWSNSKRIHNRWSGFMWVHLGTVFCSVFAYKQIICLSFPEKRLHLMAMQHNCLWFLLRCFVCFVLFPLHSVL